METVGRAPGFVLISGLGGRPDSWIELARALAREGRVAVATRDPVGGADYSADSDAPASFFPYFEAIDVAIDQLEGAAICLVGHSLGCVLASAYTRYGKYRDRIQFQALLAPLVIRQVQAFAHPVRFGARHPSAFAQAVYFVLIGSVRVPEHARQWILKNHALRSILFLPIDRRPGEISEDLADRLTSPRQVSHVQDQRLNAKDYRAEEWIAHPVKPTAYIAGERDRLWNEMDRRRLETISGRTVRRVNAGHWLHVEHAEATAREIRNALSEASAF